MNDQIGIIFSFLNQNLFNSSLCFSLIEIDADNEFIFNWKKSNNSIVVGSGFANAEISDIYSALIHEMIHMDNNRNLLEDVNINAYHNKFFWRLAVKLGLVVSKNKNQGWSETTLKVPDEFVKVQIKINKEKNTILIDLLSQLKINNEIIENNKNMIKNIFVNRKQSRTYFLKYECECPPPYNSIRSGRRPDGPNAPVIICDKCKCNFTCVSRIDD
jgi:hypothetical protein